MAFYEATQLQAFGPDGGIDPRWAPYQQQQQQPQYQGQGQQQQTQYEAKQEQILGEDGFPTVIDKNELVWQGHAASQEDAHAYGYETQYEYTPELGSGVPEYDDATTAQWQDAHQARQHAHDSAHYQQQQQQGYYHPDEQPHHEQAYSQQDQSQSLTLTQLHAAGGRPNYEQHAPAQHLQIQHQHPIQQQQHGDANANWAVKEEVADAKYRAHIALSADAILRGQGAGSGSGSSSLIPSSSSSAGSSPMKMKSEMEPPVKLEMNLGAGSGVAPFLTPAQELQMQEAYAPQQGQGQYEDYPQQQHHQQGYEAQHEQGYAQAYVPEQEVYYAQHVNHSHQQHHPHQHRQQQEQQHLAEMEMERQHLQREHHMAWARREQQYERGRREAMEAEREQHEADRAVQQQQQQQQHSQTLNANHQQQQHQQQQEWDRDEDAEGDDDEEELELPARIVPSQAHLPPTHASQAHLLPAYPQQHHQPHGYGHHQQQQYQGQRVVDPDAPFINPLNSGIPPLHAASQSLSHPRANSKSPRDRDTSNSGKGKGKAAGSTLGSPIKLGPTASLGSALGTVIPARRGRGPGRAGSLGSLGPGLDVGSGSNASAGAKGQAGVGMGELGAGDDAGERERPPEKKQALACLFCRERKIACGRPEAGSDDPTCNQCARRHICCEYPKESRRGQHKRTRKRKFGHGSEMAAEGGEGHDVNEGRVMVDTVDFRDGGGGGKALEA